MNIKRGKAENNESKEESLQMDDEEDFVEALGLDED